MHERQDRLPRVPFTRPVFFSQVGVNERPRRLLAGNVSHGGMFVRGETDVAPGTRVALSLEARGKALPFAEGEVVWHSDAAEALSRGQLPGVGVKFIRFLHPRSTELLDHLVHRSAALLPPDLAHQVIPAREEQEQARGADDFDVPPADFMRQELAELSARADADAGSTPAWANEDASVSSPPEAPEGDAWFREPEKAPPSALDADDGARIGASVVLVGILIAVALGLLWVIRRDAGPSVTNASAAEKVAVVSRDEGASEVEAVEVSASSPEAAAPVTPPAPAAAMAATGSTAIAPPQDAPKTEIAVAAPVVAPAPVKVAAPEAPTRSPAATPPAAPLSTSEKARPSSNSRRYALSSGAVSAVSISSSGDRIEGTLQLNGAASIERVFVLESPTRVVVDVAGAKPNGSVKTDVSSAGISGLRAGARDHGTRLVLDMSQPVASAEATGSGFTIRLR